MTTPKPILTCISCGHDLSELISTPWIRACPECGTRFDAEFFYEGNPQERPEPNASPPRNNQNPPRTDTP